jgi:Ras-specific guanine nucleotide-releasing factor 2
LIIFFLGLTKAEESFVADLKELASTQNNCRNIRSAITLAEPPAVPYMALFLKDVFFIEEGNKDFTQDKKVNWSKMDGVFSSFYNYII